MRRFKFYMLAIAIAILPATLFGQTISGEIPYAATPPVIDGLVDDAVWNSATPYDDFRDFAGTLTGPDDLYTVWKGLWDNENLYFHVSVVDDAVTVLEEGNGGWNEADSVEFYFDASLQGFVADALGEATFDYSAAPANEQPVFQLTQLVNQVALRNGINAIKFTDAAGAPELNGAWVVDDGFYSYEVAFPWTALGVDVGEVFGQDGVIGFGLAINDEDDGAGRDTQTMWATNNDSLWHDATEFPFVRLLPPDDVPTDDCDFDENGACDVVDINGLQGALGTNNATYDLDGSGTVDSADTDSWLSIAGNKNVGRPFVRGDSDLDGDVDAGDLNALGRNWQSSNSPKWEDGNFNGDSIVDAGDLNSVGVNWQSGVAAPLNAAVPEPTGLCLLALGMLAAVIMRRRIS